ncbi:MAG: type IV secretion system protein [Porticoccaceae bacterium]|jgi:type IV secretion system protein VirB6|nr:type IV secretion system protein [Porticoccaceae bacterium]
MASTIFERIFDMIDLALDNYVVNTSGDIIAFVTPIFSSLLIIWIAIWGYMTMTGRSGELMTEGLFRIIRVGFILTLGLTVGNYAGLVTNLLSGGPETISGIITGAPAASASASLDTLFTKIFDVSAAAWKKGGIMNGDFGQYFIALIVLIFGGAVTLIMAFLVLSSKVLTAALLAIGPISIALLLFNATQRFFESWLAMVMNQAFVLILASAIGKMLIDICNTFIDNAAANPSALATLGDAAMLCIVLGLCVLVLKQVPPIAAALGGGVALATQGAISRTMNAMRPSTIRRQVKGMQRDYNTAKHAAGAPVRGGRAAYAAYQKRFGAGNTITGT